MPNYRVNKDAVAHARKLIDAETNDDDTEWSDASPSADDGNAEIEQRASQNGHDAVEKAFDDLLHRLDDKRGQTR